MNKKELLAYAVSLGLTVSEEMTATEILAVIAAGSAKVVEPVVADATPKARGCSAVSSFKYIGANCIVSLKDGTTGRVGSSAQYPFGSMLQLKGSGIAVKYAKCKEQPKDSKHVWYDMEWSFNE